MKFLTNYTSTTFLEQLKENLRTCSAFYFSVSFTKKAGLVLLARDIEAALQRGVKGCIITSTYQNFTDIESMRTFLSWQSKYANFECHLDYDGFVDPRDFSMQGYHSKGYRFRAMWTGRALVVAAAGARHIISTGRKAAKIRLFSDLSFLLAGRRVRVNEANLAFFVSQTGRNEKL